MKYENTIKGKFIDRPNRFVAHVKIEENGELHQETVHVKNTGRCRELLLEGSQVVLQRASNPDRKTRYDLIAVYKDGLGWVNIDSQAPNKVVKEWLEGKATSKPEKLFSELTLLKPEYKFGKSRVDFYLEAGERKILIEVKGCTLEVDGTGYFPDAPTERGIKHLNELAAASEAGYECYIAFVIAMPGVEHVLPNMATHPEFGKALEKAREAGVRVLDLMCSVKPEALEIIGFH